MYMNVLRWLHRLFSLVALLVHVHSQRRPKTDIAFEALGAVDEINASLALVRVYCK